MYVLYSVYFTYEIFHERLRFLVTGQNRCFHVKICDNLTKLEEFF